MEYTWSVVDDLPAQCEHILLRAARHCIDATGFLGKSRAWLAAKCKISIRSLERWLPRLATLNLLVWNGEGFRLVRYWNALRQIGGQNAQEKESTKEKEYFELSNTRTPPTPSPARGFYGRRTKRSERRTNRGLRKDLELVRGMNSGPDVGDVHQCLRCEVPHEWQCLGETCSCGGVLMLDCSLAAVSR